jgi:glutamate carboxypeptidase
MLGLIRELVEINSHTPNKQGGDDVATRLVAMALDVGLSAQRIVSSTCADHLILSTPSASASIEGGTVLVGHHDTVFPPGTFEGFTEDGALARGPGVLDMKGGIVVMLEALRAMKAAGTFESSKIRVVLVGDEEVGSPEGKAIIETHSKGAARALVFEAGRAEDKIITARKGTGSAKVIARGKAAHAANNRTPSPISPNASSTSGS